MAEAIVGPLVGKLQELALSEAKALVAVNDDIRGLRDRLMWTQAFLRHADHRRRDTSDELIRVWLKQTRDVAFDAEDAIDEYFLKVDLSRYSSWTQSIIRFFAGFTTQVSVRHNLSSKIAEINSRLEDIIKNKEKYKIEDASNNLAMVPWKPSTAISTADTNLDDVQLPSMKRKEQDKLEEELRNPTNNSLVIYVTGESGVGKTSLVREVYERPTIKMKFEVRAWASFPPHLSSSNILQLIYQELTDTDDWLPRAGIDKKVQDELKKKTFLLVIDGEVSNTEWNGILAALPDDKKLKTDSRVVRIMHGTTPEVPRGSAAHNRVEVELSHFDKITTTDLFRRRVYMEENAEDQKPTITREMGKENKIDKKENDDKLDMEDIHHITGGLPLAIVLLCGLVKRKEFPNEWRAVFDHLKSKQSNRLDSILTMCFDDLPHDMKSCFLYFAALPMNTPIEARKLICMWMAEGFLRPKYGKTMETVGRIYLKELIGRHLVKFVNMDNFSGDDEFVTVHHKVHAFLQLEAQEANFVEIHNGDDIPSLTTARRLSLQNYTDKYAALAYSLPKLRSILSNFQEEIEDDVEDDEEEGKEEEIYRGGHEEKEGEQKEDGDGDGEEGGQGKRKEEQEGVGCIEEEVQNSENVGDGDNKQKGQDEEGKNIVKGVENERNEEAKEEVKPSTMPLPNLLRCWGQGASPQVPINVSRAPANSLANHAIMHKISLTGLEKWNRHRRRITSSSPTIKSYIRRMLRVSKFLRVINLQGIEIGEKLPAEIGKVVHLQYLGVTACSLKWIPSTIGKLTNLQTLDVRDTCVRKLPTAFWKIRTLRHVFGSRLVLPKHVGNLKHLQTLETIQHDEDWDSKTFEKMVHLKSIDIRDFSDSNARALFDAIEKPEFLEYLVTLTLHVKNIPLCVFTSSSQRRLRAMKLDGKLSLPSEPKDSKFCLPNLTLLSLEETGVSQDFINKLGKLPSLANLILATNSYKEDKLVFLPGGFRSLTNLMLLNLENLKKVAIGDKGESALPELTELVIVWYPEDIKIVVYGKRAFVNKIQLKDENLHAKIQIPIDEKKITQEVASSSA